MSKKYLVHTLGCKANLYDSQLIEASLQKQGWQPVAGSEPGDVGLCIINSCTVTDEADRQSRKLASRLSKQYPGAKVVLTGCSAEVDPQKALKAVGVDYVVGNRDKPQLVELVSRELGSSETSARVLGTAEGYEEMRSRHPMDREWPLAESRFEAGESGLSLQGEQSHRTRAFLKIQDGCNSFCTYCVIPYGRGPSRSLPIATIVEQVQELVKQGLQEIVITGINIGDYGVDRSGKMELDELVTAILADTDIARIRVSSLDPTEITPTLMRLAESNPRFCPHFHVSLQSPHSRILRLMKRKYDFEKVQECLTALGKLTAPAGGVFVGMDVITGFPGETPEEFEWGVEALSELAWSRLHVFPYSEREGTPATRLPDSVPPIERARRAKILRALSLDRLKSVYQKALDHTLESHRPLTPVLIESSVRGPDGTRDWLSGYSLNYLRVLVRAHSPGVSENRIVSTLKPVQIWVDADAGDVAFLAESLKAPNGVHA